MANPNTIPFLHYQDIQLSDVALKQQFVNYFNQGEYAQALSLLNTNADQLLGKAYVSNTVNIIVSGILDLENRFNTNVTLFLSNLNSQYNQLISNFRNRKAWLANVTYSVYNFVIYNEEIYMCLQAPPAGTLPTVSTYWLYIGLRGENGAPGVNVNMKFDWDNTTAYSPNDLVVYQNSLYVALQSNTGVTPGSSSDTWLLFIEVVAGEIYVSTTAPTSAAYLVQNSIWFQVETDPNSQNNDNPILGQFYRYNEVLSDWEEMYPRTTFTMIVDSGFVPGITEAHITIEPSDWIDRTWTYTASNLTTDSIVDVFHDGVLTQSQYYLYSGLSISISNNIISLTASAIPTVSLPIIIRIA